MRDVNLAHVSSMKEAVKKRGYRSNVGSLSVSLKSLGNLEDGTVVDGCFIELGGLNFNLVDGLHRLKALLELVDEDEDWKKRCEKLECMFWFKEHNTPLPDLDNVRLGSHLNDATGLSMRSTVRDHVFTAVSIARVVRLDRTFHLSDMTNEVVRDIIEANRCIGGQKRRQLSRYARIATRIAPSQELVDSFLEAFDISNGNLGLSHVTHTLLLNMTDGLMKFSMKAIGIRMGSMKKGRFEDFANMFLHTSRAIYEDIGRVAMLNSKSIEEVLETPCRLGNETISMEIFCLAAFAKVAYKEDGEERRKAKRLKDVTKKLDQCGFTVTAAGESTHPAVEVVNDIDIPAPEPEPVRGPPRRRRMVQAATVMDSDEVMDTTVQEGMNMRPRVQTAEEPQVTGQSTSRTGRDDAPTRTMSRKTNRRRMEAAQSGKGSGRRRRPNHKSHVGTPAVDRETGNEVSNEGSVGTQFGDAKATRFEDDLPNELPFNTDDPNRWNLSPNPRWTDCCRVHRETGHVSISKGCQQS